MPLFSLSKSRRKGYADIDDDGWDSNLTPFPWPARPELSRSGRKAFRKAQAPYNQQRRETAERGNRRTQETVDRQAGAASVASNGRPSPPSILPRELSKPAIPKSTTFRALEQLDGSMISHVWKDKALKLYMMRKCVQLRDGKFVAHVEAATDEVRKAWCQQNGGYSGPPERG